MPLFVLFNLFFKLKCGPKKGRAKKVSKGLVFAYNILYNIFSQLFCSELVENVFHVMFLVPGVEI